MLVRHFQKNCWKVKTIMLITCNILHTMPFFTFDEVSENDTLSLLWSLKESKSTGLDKINARLVKDYIEVVCPTLTKIFNSSLHAVSSGGSSVSQNKLPQLVLGYIYILKYLQSNFIG